MADGSALVRQWKLIASLASRQTGVDVTDLARELGVDAKTIRRDFVTLRRAGVPVSETISDYGRKLWRLAPDQALAPMSFNWMEAASLYLARQFLEPLAGTHFWTSANSAFAKLRATLGEQPLHYLDKMSAAFHQTARRPKRYADKADLLDELTRAIEERRITQLTYRSERATEPATRDIHPLGWVFHNGAVYLVAYASEHGQRRIYKLDRMEAVHVTDMQYVPPDDLSLSQFMAGSLGVYQGDSRTAPITVRVRFLPTVTRYVNEHPRLSTFPLTPQPDGSVVGEFQLTSTQELKSMILSFGPNAMVLEPDSLRKEIAADLRRTLSSYTAQKTNRVRQKPKRKPK